MAKLPLEKQIEKAAKEQQKAAREVAMRQRASTIVNSQPIVDGVRILDTTAALVLKCLVEQCKDVNSGHVSFRNDTLPKAVEHSVGLEIEKRFNTEWSHPIYRGQTEVCLICFQMHSLMFKQ